MTSAPLSLQPLLSKHWHDIISADWKWGLPGEGRRGGGADMFRFETGSVTQRGDETERERGDKEGGGGIFE